MKKTIYIFLSVILFILLSLILHVLIELPIIYLMVGDMDKWSLGLTWDQLMLVHWTFTITLLLLGIVFGVIVGKKWWQYIYIDKKYQGRWFKKLTVLLLIISPFAFSGCQKEPIMDQPADDGRYHYRNPDLGFSVVLPEEFIYYQTQRKTTAFYNNIEFYVPTNDTNYAQEVPGYAKPLTVFIYTVPDWDERIESRVDKDKFIIKGEGGDDRAYALRFWDKTPNDWTERWNDDIKQSIIDNFEIK